MAKENNTNRGLANITNANRYNTILPFWKTGAVRYLSYSSAPGSIALDADSDTLYVIDFTADIVGDFEVNFEVTNLDPNISKSLSVLIRNNSGQVFTFGALGNGTEDDFWYCVSADFSGDTIADGVYGLIGIVTIDGSTVLASYQELAQSS